MNVEVRVDKKRKSFIAEVDGHEAYLDYTLSNDKIILTHTYTPIELRGKGLAGQIVKFAFDYAKKQNLKVVPSCPYIFTFLKKNEEYRELVAG